MKDTLVLVVSDSHGIQSNLYRTVMRTQPDIIYHLGDAVGFEDEIRSECGVPIYYVRGNCDFGSDAPIYQVTSLGRHKIFLTHGHMYNVKYSDHDLICAAMKEGCDTVIFGHTHIPELIRTDGMTIINPGSISLPRQPGRIPTYATIDVDSEGELHFTINELKD